MTLGRWLGSAGRTAGASAQTGPRSIRAQRPASIPQARLRGGPVVAITASASGDRSVRRGSGPDQQEPVRPAGPTRQSRRDARVSRPRLSRGFALRPVGGTIDRPALGRRSGESRLPYAVAQVTPGRPAASGRLVAPLLRSRAVLAEAQGRRCSHCAGLLSRPATPSGEAGVPRGQGGAGAAHAARAAYFRAQADAGADDRWELKARPLTELPFHLAGAGSDADLGADRCQTFHTWRPVIVSRVRFTSSSTITPLPIHIQPLAMLDWRSFLQKHLQRLSRHPASLLALVNHEGFAGAREQIATACWRGAWLRTAPEATPIPESERARAKGRGRGKHQIQQPSDDRGGGRATDRLLPGAPRHASRGRPGFDAGDQPNPRDRIGTPVGARVRARRQQSGRDARIGHRGLLPVSTGGRRVACGTRACDRAALPSARVQRPGPHLGLRCVLVPSGRRRAGAGVRRQLRGPGGASSDRADRRALGHGLLRNEASDRHQTRP